MLRLDGLNGLGWVGSWSEFNVRDLVFKGELWLSFGLKGDLNSSERRLCVDGRTGYRERSFGWLVAGLGGTLGGGI